MDGKYPDKRILCSYDLDIKLFHEFNLEVLDLIPLRSVFVLNTDKGKKILKKIDYPISRLNFILKALEYISFKFNRVITFEKSIKGENHVIWGDCVYIVLNVLNGRECEISNPVDVIISSQGLRELHEASYGIQEFFMRDDKEIDYNEELGRFPIVLRDSLELLKNIKSQVTSYKYKNSIDSIFLNEVDCFTKEIEECISMIENSNYERLCEDKRLIALCHNDLAHHNILIEEEKAFFLDFDYASIDLRIKDLSNFIEKSIKGFDYDIEIAKNIIKNYTLNQKMSKDEYEIMYIMLKFPHDFVSICKNYYLKQKDWEEKVFLERFIKKASYKNDKKLFLKDYKNNFLK